MAWNRDEPDPLENRKRQLAEQERALAEQRRRLTEQLQASPQTSAQAKRAEPLVWRTEDDSIPARAPDPTPARKRALARQRQNDMILVFVLVALLVVVLGVVLWIAHVHTAT